ncbi:DNA/RNA non-specific endonuclease, partial [Candidatus Clostridium stratigraminis]
IVDTSFLFYILLCSDFCVYIIILTPGTWLTALESESSTIMFDEKMNEKAPYPSEAMEDLELYSKYSSGEYRYNENEYGKSANGILELEDNPQRNSTAQLSAGGESRRFDDDGGHLIGVRFGGEIGQENLEAQNRNLNRGTYKQLENSWASSLKDGKKIFANIETYKNEGSDRPEAFMGYAITENDDGSRDLDTFSFQNESASTQSEWNIEFNEIVASYDKYIENKTQ